MTELSPEFRLIAACCIWPPSQRRMEAVTRAAAEVRDWDRVVRLVRRHRVAALVDDGLKQGKVDVPAAARESVRNLAARASLRSLQLAAESVRVRDALHEAGVRGVFLKGAALAALAFGQIGIKASWDVDVLVPQEDFARADAALEAAGYRRQDPPRDFDERRVGVWLALMKEALYIGGPSAAGVELHWKLVDHACLLPGLTAHAALRNVDIGGQVLPTFGDEDLFAYLCVHGAHHGWARLKWLADVAAFVASRDIDALYDACVERRAKRCAGQALLLCERLFGLQLPARLRAALHSDRTLRVLERLALEVMLEEAEIQSRPWTLRKMRASHFLLGKGLGHVIAELKVKLTGRRDRLDIALPSQLDFLYAFIRLPMWLWRRMARA